MDKIARTTSLITGIVDVYNHNNFQVELENIMNAICTKFDSVLTANAEKYKLITTTSVQPVKYFKVIGRVKAKDSFHEKMIRNSLIYDFLKETNYTSKKQISRRRNEVEAIIKKVSDDIIGIRILTELEEDCKQVIRFLLDNHSSHFSDINNIYLDLEDLEKQPVKMKNGFDIYKIKGTYSTSFKFELQIKSKLLAVWGDMDHSMFYKDYSVSPVKENVKESMNHLGSLIIQVDKFLFQIREAENSFTKNRDVIDFIESFSNQYSEVFKSKLGFGFRLEDISEFLFYLYKDSSKKLKRKLDFGVLSLRGADEFVKHYVKLRNTNFNLQIIELVYFDWFSTAYKDDVKRKNNFNRTIPKLMAKYCDFLLIHLRDEFERYKEYFRANFIDILSHFKSGSILYSFEKLNNFFSALSTIESFSDFDEKYDLSEKLKIKNFLLITYFDQDGLVYLKKHTDEILQEKMSITLTRLAFSYQGKRLDELQRFKEADMLRRKGLNKIVKL